MLPHRRFPLLLAGALLLLAACSGKDDIQVPEETTVALRSVSLSADEVVVPVGGTVSVPFTVNHPNFSFNFVVSSSTCQVFLVKQGGQSPTEYRIREIIPGSSQGSYTAVFADTGGGKIYEESVCLAIRMKPGSDAYVSSSFFTVRSERKESRPDLQTGLPVVYVDTENGKGVTSKTEYVPATLFIRGEGDLEGLESVTCSIRGRGNTTWGWPKKPYLIRLDEKEHIFGMHKHKRWVLLANFMDKTLMRNMVAMKVSSMTSLAWTPGCVPVELVLNGKHLGTYLLIEQVRVDNHRVDITEMTPEDNAGEAVTGGYLLELDFHYDNEVQWVDPHGGNAQWGGQAGIPFGVKYPDPEDLTPQQLAYIKQYVYDAAEALYGPDFTDPEKGYAKYLDVDSFIDYWIVFEVMGNHELGNPGSVFLHKDRGGKLVAGPCWDFDWGVLSYNTSPQARTGLINGSAIWYARLMQDPAFKAKLKARFNELLPQLETIPDYMDECEALLKASATLNFGLWNPASDGMINGDENLSFHDATARLKSIYRDRLRVIPANL